MPSRGGLRANPKATFKKQALKSAPLRKQKRKATRSDNDSIDGNSTDSELVVLQPKKKRSKAFQRDSEGGDDGRVSDGEENLSDSLAAEVEEVTSSAVMFYHIHARCTTNINIPLQAVDDLQEHHRLTIPQESTIKKDVAVDILLIFTDKVLAKFINEEDNKVTELRGRWCLVCR
jgi:hypothetical protein